MGVIERAGSNIFRSMQSCEHMACPNKKGVEHAPSYGTVVHFSIPNVRKLLLLTGVSLHPPAPKGGPTRTSADASVPRLAEFSLIT
jgi:hypothetical protein